jgi:hypothetical protein
MFERDGDLDGLEELREDFVLPLFSILNEDCIMNLKEKLA